jgi:outer membrane receptor for ferrienterochelin and colicins
LQEHSDSGDANQEQFYLTGPIVSELLGLQLWGRLYNRGEDRIESGWSKANDHDLGGKLTLTPTENQDVVLTGGYTRLERNATAGKSLEKDADDTRNKQDRLFYSLAHTGRWDFGTTDLSILQEKAERRSWTESDEEGRVKNPRSPEILNTVVDGKVQVPLDLPVVGVHSLVLGGQWTSTELTDQNPGRRTGQDEKFKVWQQALFIEDEWLITDNFSLTGGLRIDDHEIYGAHWSPRGYAVWHPAEEWTVKGGVSTGFRAPDIRTIAPGYAYTTGGGNCTYGPNGTCGVIIGDPDLEPEKSTSYEFSVGWNSFEWISANATYFYTDFKDKVSNALVVDDAGNPVRWAEDPNYRLWYNYNIDDAVLQGVELSATYQPTETLVLTGSYTYTDSEQKTGTYSGFPLARTPEHLANVRVDWTTPVAGLRTWARADYHGKELNAGLRLGQNGTPIEQDGQIVAREYDSYFTFDIGANYALTEQVLLSAAIYNVGDERLEPDSYNTVGDGRRFWLGTTVKF